MGSEVKFSISFILRRNNVGPNTKPSGTPVLIVNISEVQSSRRTLNEKEWLTPKTTKARVVRYAIIQSPQ